MPGTTAYATPAAGQGLGLLAAAAEDERVAALQAHHPPPAQAVLHEDRVDLVLGHRLPAPATLPAFSSSASGRHSGSSSLGAEAVVHHHVGAPRARAAGDGEQAGVAGAGADQVDEAAHRADGGELGGHRGRGLGVGDRRPRGRRAHRAGAVVGAGEGDDPQAVAVRLAVSADRLQAAAAERREQRALGAQAGVGGGVVERRHGRAPCPGRRRGPAAPAAPARGPAWRRPPAAGSSPSGSGPGGAGRRRPARARRRRPASSFSSRVPTLPRIGTTSRSGRASRIWAARRGLPVATVAPAGEAPPGRRGARRPRRADPRARARRAPPARRAARPGGPSPSGPRGGPARRAAPPRAPSRTGPCRAWPRCPTRSSGRRWS